jgi:signal peptidase II
MRRLLPWFTVVLIVALDRVTKILVMKHIEPMRPDTWINLFPGLTITHIRNSGIAFGLFSDAGPIPRMILHMVIGVAVVTIAWIMVKQSRRGKLTAMAFWLILGGAIGNLLDRIIYGWVVDFIHVWVQIGDKIWSWFDFNIADSAITTGACLLILHELISIRGKEEDASGSD